MYQFTIRWDFCGYTGSYNIATCGRIALWQYTVINTCIVVDLVGGSALFDLAWYLMFGCVMSVVRNVVMDSCSLCSHAQAGHVTVTLRQPEGEDMCKR